MNPDTMRQKALKLCNIDKLNFEFSHPPLLVAGMAMMYHGLRESDKDVDYILHPDDHQKLAIQFKNQAKVLEGSHNSGYKDSLELVDLYGDHGIIVYQFELWDSIFQFSYQDLIDGAIKEADFLVISLEKLLLLCLIRGLQTERYLDDAKLIAKEITRLRYDNFDESQIGKYWPKLMSNTDHPV